MKSIFLSLFTVIFLTINLEAQVSIKYDPQAQPTGNMQYFIPAGEGLFVGDCIPFYHNGTFYLYWLIDKRHHSLLGGLGGHQWVLSTTNDLKTWVHYPVVLGIDEEWEKSICTGSVAFHDNKFYAFYATRLIDKDGRVNEQLSYAISDDGINFTKQKPNPFYTSAPGYSKRDFRDPKVVIDKDGLFHLFVASMQDKKAINAGCLVHLVSRDLKTWDVKEPLLTGHGWVPECPDYFKWNDWYYLISGHYYFRSKHPYGPWEYPSGQIFDEPYTAVPKTAVFDGRRIAASWIPSKKDNKDNGQGQFGGNILLRELIQHKDGTLGVKFPEEALPEIREKINFSIIADENIAENNNSDFAFNAQGASGLAYIKDIPADCMITAEIEPVGPNEECGMFLRSSEKEGDGYKLVFSGARQTVALDEASIKSVPGMNKTFKVQIVMKGDFIDVCINNERTLVNRLPEKRGGYLWLFAKNGKVKFRNLSIWAI